MFIRNGCQFKKTCIMMHPESYRESVIPGGHVDQACRNLMDRLPAVLRVFHEIDVESSGKDLWKHGVYLHK